MYRAEITHKHDFCFQAKAGEAELEIDAKGKGFTPLDAFLSGLASCVGVYIRKYAEGAKLEIENFKVTVEADLGHDPLSFKHIELKLDLNGAKLEERRKEALLNFVRNCPAHNTLKGNPEIEFKLI